jgi:hypothetical protein
MSIHAAKLQFLDYDVIVSHMWVVRCRFISVITSMIPDLPTQP